MNVHGAPEEVLAIPTARDTGAEASSAMNEPVLGCRAWLVERGRDGYRFWSVLVPARWADASGAWTRAVCRPQAGIGSPHTPHDDATVPELDCTCGLYAYRSLSLGGYDGRLAQADDTDLRIVWGAVAGTGRVLANRDGWRAQFARPVAILRESRPDAQLRAMADQLGIPLVSSSEMERVASQGWRPWRTNTMERLELSV
ncbi:MAG TPA: hypothetical protein VE953_23425 [Terriglobales bacterium]|nr:hypothetical protein [Terriglobales bacterium]